MTTGWNIRLALTERELVGEEVMQIEGTVVFVGGEVWRTDIRGVGAAVGVSGIFVSWSLATDDYTHCGDRPLTGTWVGGVMRLERATREMRRGE